MDQLYKLLLLHRLLKPTKSIKQLLVGFFALGISCAALANPALDNVAAGNVTVQQTNTSTTVNQSSQKAILNWKSFNIGSGETTHFQQPAGGIALNRISPNQGASSIYGTLTATGQIILINPAGIYFGPSAYVNVGGLVATTHNITDENFLNGNYQFNKVDGYAGAIVNEGTIIAAQHGLIALVAPGVINNGVIQANMGKVVLASGDAFTMSFDGNGLVNFAIDQKTSSRAVDRNGNLIADGVKNTGAIYANGGSVLVTAKAAAGVLDKVINMEGIVQAQSVGMENGEIILSADTDIASDNIVRVAGTLDASGKKAGEKGGKVEITGKYILADAGTNIDVSGDAGGGNVYIGGNYLGQGPLPNATAVVTAENTSINASAISNGDGGEVILWSDDYTNVNSNISARGGEFGGDGGFIETSSKNILNVGDILVDASAPAGNMGTWLLDPRNVTINATSTTGGTFDGGSPTNTFTPSSDDATVLNSTINTNLASANVTITTGATGVQAGNITVSAPITWASTNSLTFIAANNIAINAAITTGAAGSALILNAAGTITQTAVIGGSGGVTKLGAGTATFDLANTYTGLTSVSAGTLIASHANALGSTAAGTTIFSGATLNINNVAIGAETITFDSGLSSTTTLSGTGSASLAGNIALSSTIYNTLTASGASDSLTLSGVISGGANASTSNLSFQGDGLVTVSGANTYLGVSYIFGKALATNSASLGATGDLPGSFNYTSIILDGQLQLAGSITSGESIYVRDNGADGLGSVLATSGSPTLSGPIHLFDANASIGVSSGATLTISGVVSDANPLTKLGTGTLVLSGSNTYSGLTTVSAGTLTAVHANALGTTASGITVASGATLNINGVAIGAEALTITGTGVSGAGALQGTGTGSLAGAVSITSSATVGGTGTLTLSGLVSGGSMTKAGSGTVILSNTGNSFSPSLIIDSGTLRLGAAGVIANATAVVLANTAGASLDLNGFNETIGTLSGGGTTGGNITLGAGTLTVTQGSDQTYAGVISGSGGFSKSGLSTLTLSGANTYTGLTRINLGGGTLVASHASALGSTSTGTSIFDGGTLLINNVAIGSENVSLLGASTIEGTGTASLAGTVTFGEFEAPYDFASNSGTLTLSGVIDGFSENDLNIIGNGTVVLSGANTFSFTNGILIANGATLSVSADNNLGATTNSINFNGGTLQTTADFTLNSARNLSLSSGAGTLSTNSGTTVTYNGVISGTNVFTKAGDGTLTLGGTNTYSGATHINGGILNISNDSGLGTAPGVFTPDHLVLNGGTLQNNSLSFSINQNRGITLGSSNGTFLVTGFGGTTLTYNGTIAGTGSLIKAGPSILALTSTNTYSGGTIINAGLLQISSDGALGSVPGSFSANNITFNGGSFRPAFGVNLTINPNRGIYLDTGGGEITSSSNTSSVIYDGVISGPGNLLFSGNGTFQLGGSNTYTGTTTLDFEQGALQLNHANALSGTSSITITNGDSSNGESLLNINFSNATLAGTAPIFMSGFADTPDTGIRFTGTNAVINNNITLVTDVTLSGSGSGTLGGVISGGFGFTKYGTGTITISGNNTYTGNTTASEGILVASHANAFGNQIGNDTSGWVWAENGATISLDNVTLNKYIFLTGNGAAGTDGALIGTGTAGVASTGTIDLFTSSPTIGGSGTLTIAAPIIQSSGTGLGITKAGSGTVILSGNNSYTGTTTVSAGTLSAAHVNALGTTAAGTNILSGGTLNINNVAIGAEAITFDSGLTSTTTLSGTGTASLAGNISLSSTIYNTINAANLADSLTLSGIISGGANLSTSNLSFTGNGLTTLSGANTYLGTTYVFGRVLASNSASLGATGDSPGFNYTSIIVDGQLQLAGSITSGEAIYVRDNGADGLGGILATSGAPTLSGPIHLFDANASIGTASGTTLTISGVVSDANPLTKLGTGTLVLSANNTYSGLTTISAGTLTAAHANALGTTASGTTVASGATLNINGVAIGAEALTITGTGVSGAGALQGTGTGSLAGTISITSSATVGGAGTLTLSGLVSGGSMTKAGSGTVILSNTGNSFGPSLIIDSGTLRLGAAGVIANATAVVLANTAGVSLDLNGFNETIGTLSGGGTTGGNITLGAGTLTVTQGSDQTYAGIISGTGGSLVKAGASNLILSGNNTFTGGTTLNAGTLTVSHNNALGTGTLTFGGGTLQAGSSGINLANAYVLGTNAIIGGSNALILSGNTALTGSNVLTVNNTADTTLSGTKSGTGSFTKEGSGTLIFAGTGSYTGDTNINAGILKFDSADSDALSSSTNVTIASGATLDLNGTNEFFGSLAGAGNVDLNNDANTIGGNLVVNANNASTIFSGIISGLGDLEKIGTGTLTLSGANTYTGSTFILGGTLQLGASNVISNSSSVTLSDVAGVVFDLNDNSETIGTLSGGGATGGNILLGTGTLTITQGSDQTFAGIISGSAGSLVKAGASNLTLSGNNTFTGGTTLNAGTLTVGHNNALGTGTLTYNAGTLTAGINGLSLANNININANLAFTGSNDAAFSGIINDAAGTFGLSKSGTSNLTLSGNNTFDGGVTLDAGTLTVGHNNALGTGTLTYNAGTFASSTSVTLANNIALNAALAINSGNDITLNGIINDAAGTFGLSKSGSGNLTLAGNNTFDGGVSLDAGTLTVGHNNALGTGTLTYNAGTLTAGINGLSLANNININANLAFTGSNDATFSGIINDAAGTFGLSKSGSSNLTLSGNNTFDGGVTLDAGILTVGHNNALGTGTLTYNAGTLTAGINGLSLANNININANLAFTGSNDATFSGIINDAAGTFGLSKSGTSNLTLSGNNTFDGGVTLDAGTLTVGHNNALGTGTLTYNAGTFASSTSVTLTNNVLLNAALAINSGNDITLNGIINDAASSFGLSKSGSGNLTLAGNNTFDGGVTLNAGTLTVGHNSALGTGTLTYNAGTLTAGINGLSLANNININANLAFTGSNDATFSGIINDAAGTFGLSKSGTSNLTLSGNNTFDGGVTLNAGILTVGHNSALGTGTLTYNAGTLTAGINGLNLANNINLNNNLAISSNNNLTLAGVIDDGVGSFGLTKSGVGDLTLSAANTYDGITTVNSGILNVDDDQALGSSAAGTIVNAGATLAFNDVDVGNEAITLNNGSAMTSTGTSSLTGAITLSNGSNATVTAPGTFNLSGNINGAGGLTMGGAGSYVLTGNMGNSTPLNFLQLNSDATISGTITTVSNQTFTNAITLGANTIFTTAIGNINFGNTLNGAFDLVINGSGPVTFNGAVGGTAALNSLSIDASGINITVNGGAITTVGSQTYNALVTLDADANFTTNGAGTLTLAFNNGIAGGQNITLTGGATANETFLLAGSITANDITIDGGNGGGTNTLNVNTASTQNWNITAANGGNITGIAGVGGTFSFNDIHNLTGGSNNDNFTLTTGTLAGSINGSGGTNTLTAANVANTWNLSGTNAATSVTGITSGFSNIQNLIGGSGNDNFIFANNATITGSINGGTPFTNDGNNIFTFSAYSTPVTVNLIGDIFSGNVKNNGGGNIIASYSNIDNLIANPNVGNSFVLPAGKSAVTITGITNATIGTKEGFIGDPTFFFGFLFNQSSPAPASSPTPSTETSASPNPAVAQIIQQPQVDTTGNEPVILTSQWVNNNYFLAQNIGDLIDQTAQIYQNELNTTGINPYCSVGG